MPLPSPGRPRLRLALAAAGLVLILAGCVPTGTTRESANPQDAQTVQENLAVAANNLRSYAILDDEFAPEIRAHLFGIPGLRSLSSVTEARVLAAIESNGSFGGRAAYSPVLTDPAARRPAERFIVAPQVQDPRTTGAPTSGASDAGTAGKFPTEAEESEPGERLEIGNEVLAAGGDFLVSRLWVRGPGDDRPQASVLVTQISTDTTVDIGDLFDAEVDAAAIAVDAFGHVTLEGSQVPEKSLTALGRTVSKSLRTPLALPAAADERRPDYSCSLLPCVALTYDDGPGDPEGEDSLLDAAAEAGVRLTYFLLGRNVAAYPGTVERMVDQGHEIANHTHSHPQLDRSSPATVRAQVRQADDAIEAAGAGRPELLRPPFGALDSAAAGVLGHPAILWDVDTEDWRHKNPGKVVASVARDARPGSIVLMHSIHPSTIEASPQVFRTVAEKGLYAVTTSELFAGVELSAGAQYYCRGYGSELCSNPEHPAVLRN